MALDRRIYDPEYDVVVCKTGPSMMFQTPVVPYFIRQRVDTVILTGCNTSGCIRATAIDSFQTCMNSASGLFDQQGDHLTLWGMLDEPMTPEQDKQVKYVYRNFGQDKWTLEIHDMMIGESNTKVFEVEYRRKKK